MTPQVGKLRERGDELVPGLKDLQNKLLIAGGAAAVVCAIGLLLNPAQFVRSLLPTYMWLLSITLGSLALRWSISDGGGGVSSSVASWVLRVGRCRCSPYSVIPICARAARVYPWPTQRRAEDAILQCNQPYLKCRFSWCRSHLLAVWNASRLSKQMVARAGHHRRSGRGAPDAEAQCGGSAGLRIAITSRRSTG